MHESWPHLKNTDPGRVADHGVFTDTSADIPAKREWNVVIITYYAPGEVTTSVAARNRNFREQVAVERLSFSLHRRLITKIHLHAFSFLSVENHSRDPPARFNLRWTLRYPSSDILPFQLLLN